MIKFTVTLCAVLLTASTLYAQSNEPQDMSHCVKEGKLLNAGRIQEFLNICDRPIRLYLCRSPGECGSRRSYHPYFTTSEVLGPDGFHYFTVVGSQEFRVAACSYHPDKHRTAPVMLDADGKYRCEFYNP